jgi:Uma2 family endonuclease
VARGTRVVEIASDGDPRFDEREKLPRYREAGVPEIVLVSPQTQTVRIDRLRRGAYATERLSSGWWASSVLPGFGLAVEDLWATPLPSSLSRLRTLLG